MTAAEASDTPEVVTAQAVLAQANDPLTVIVTSFSYHRGPVADESGHGGGYTFDARGLPNPGRETRFKSLTGRDPEVGDLSGASTQRWVNSYSTHWHWSKSAWPSIAAAAFSG